MDFTLFIKYNTIQAISYKTISTQLMVKIGQYKIVAKM